MAVLPDGAECGIAAVATQRRPQAADPAGQHVARAGCREQRIAGRVDRRQPRSCGDDGTRSLEHDRRAEAVGKALCGADTIAWTSALGIDNSRAASSGCGVNTVGKPRAPRATSSVCKAVSTAIWFSASASSTSRAACAISGGKVSRTASPPPQPATAVLVPSTPGGNAHQRRRTISSGRSGSNAGAVSSSGLQ